MNGYPDRLTEGHGGLAREPGKLVSFADIKGQFPSTSMEWGMALDDGGNPWILAARYNWNQFLVQPDHGFTLFAQARTPAMDANDELARYGEAKAAYDEVNAAIFAANGWNRRRFYDANYVYSPNDPGYVPTDWKTRQPIALFNAAGVTIPADDGRDELSIVRIPISPTLASAIESLGYKSFDGLPFALVATVNRWSRIGYFTGFNIVPTTRFQLDIARLSTPARLGALISSWVALGLSVITVNIPGIIGALATAGTVVGQAVGESEAAIGAALREEGVIPTSLKETARAAGVSAGGGYAPARAPNPDKLVEESPIPLWAVAAAGGALLLAWALS